MPENDPLERLRMFPGSTAEQIIALTDLWKQRTKRTFVAMRERMNEVEELEVRLEPAAFDNYFRRANREKTPEAVVWALIRVMRDESWLPREQQCTLAEALYLAALKNVSVVTYARIYQLFPGQEEEFRRLCPLGDLIVERAHPATPDAAPARPAAAGPQSEAGAESPGLAPGPGTRRLSTLVKVSLLALLAALILWTLISSIGWAPR